MSDIVHCPVCASAVSPDSASCPICGFRLLGTTQSFNPVIFDQQANIASARSHAYHASLRVVRGPQVEIVIPLLDKEVIIGRSPQSDAFLNDMTVSRTHAMIVPCDKGYKIVDCNSFNGVWVNNVNVESKILNHGDLVQIGSFLLVYEQE